MEVGAWIAAGPTLTLTGVDGITLPSRYAVTCQPERHKSITFVVHGDQNQGSAVSTLATQDPVSGEVWTPFIH